MDKLVGDKDKGMEDKNDSGTTSSEPEEEQAPEGTSGETSVDKAKNRKDTGESDEATI